MYYLDVLNRLTDPILVLDANARVQFANLAAHRYFLRTKFCGINSQGRLFFKFAQMNRELLSVLSSFSQDPERPDPFHAFTLPKPGELRPWRVLISPLGANRDRGAPPRRFLVQLVRRLHPRNLPVNVLRRLFELTQREVEVVRALNRYGSLPAAAAQLQISRETARAHLKSIFNKVNVNSQLELILTLQKLCLFGEIAMPVPRGVEADITRSGEEIPDDCG